MFRLPGLKTALLSALLPMIIAPIAHAAEADFQTVGIQDNMPAFYKALKAKLNFQLAWTPAVKDLPAWRKAGRDKMWELTLQSPERTPFNAVVLDEQDRGSYLARKVVFNVTAESRVQALLLVPKGKGPFPAALMLHDHGSKFDIGKEKLIETWGNDARLESSKAWAKKYFSERFPGDELAKRGYVVLATDALGWGDRAALAFDIQQAVAANAFNLGSSLAGIMALEDARSADFLATQAQVDKKRVAVVGFSMGAFRAWQVAALSDSITAGVVVNWLATTEGLMVPGNNQLKGASAWNMLHPGVLRYLDFPDVASLAAPKPMLFFAGEKDPLFPVDSVKASYDKLHKVWGAWKADDKLDTRMLPGGHEFIKDTQDTAYDWLDKQFANTR
ncbi:dienelactone hydrolase family protein [Uliginosibacterium sediminicola]|uniref:Alpha/beta fold hydrolase n=1 Tax=Uliginosibacterium sediminicola TaxID=2024550 RepID=A0ABU9YTD1_9RHOO